MEQAHKSANSTHHAKNNKICDVSLGDTLGETNNEFYMESHEDVSRIKNITANSSIKIMEDTEM